MYKNPLHSYILRMKFQEKKWEGKKSLLQLQNKRIKYLATNLTKDVKDLHIGNCKTLLEDIKKWQNILCSRIRICALWTLQVILLQAQVWESLLWALRKGEEKVHRSSSNQHNWGGHNEQCAASFSLKENTVLCTD